jgi:hypothetical protein
MPRSPPSPLLAALLCACTPATPTPWTPSLVPSVAHPLLRRLPSNEVPFPRAADAAPARPVPHPAAVAVLWPHAELGVWGIAWAGLDQPWTFEPLDPELSTDDVLSTDAVLAPDGVLWAALRRRNAEVLAYRWTPGAPARGEQVAPYVQSSPAWPDADDLWLDVAPNGTAALTFARRLPFAAEHAAVYLATQLPGAAWSTELVFSPQPDADPELRFGAGARVALLPDGRPVLGVVDRGAASWRWRAAPETWVELGSTGPDDPDELRRLGCPDRACFDLSRDHDGTVWRSPTSERGELLPLRVAATRAHADHSPALAVSDAVAGLHLRATPCGLDLPGDPPCPALHAAPFTTTHDDPEPTALPHGHQPYRLGLNDRTLLGGRRLPDDPGAPVPWIPASALPRLLDLQPAPDLPVDPTLTELRLTLDHPFASAEVRCTSATPGLPQPLVTWLAEPEPWQPGCDGALLIDETPRCASHERTLTCTTDPCLPAGHLLWCHLHDLTSATATATPEPLLHTDPPLWTWQVAPAAAGEPPPPTLTCLSDACGCLPFPDGHPLAGALALDLTGAPATPAALLDPPETLRLQPERATGTDADATWQIAPSATAWRPVQVQASRATLTWPTALLPERSYQLQLDPGARDVHTGLPWPATPPFTTGPGPLTLSTLDRTPEHELLLVFSLPVDPATLAALTLSDEAADLPFTTSLDDPSTARLTPDQPPTGALTLTLPDTLRSDLTTCARPIEGPLRWTAP